MKILILIQCTNLGGMEQSTLLLVEELIKMGHEVEILSINEIGPLRQTLEAKRIPFSAVGYRGTWGWRSFLPLKRILRDKKSDALIMVGHNLMGMLAIGGFCKSNRILSLHFHHQGVKSKLEWSIIYAVALMCFKRIIYPSRFIMNEALAFVPRLQATDKIVSYPISTPISLPEASLFDSRQKSAVALGLDPKMKYIGNAGWLIPRKRWDIFLKVAAEVAVSVPNARFLIAGDGPEKGTLKRLARELQIEDLVIWLGWQKGLNDFYRVLDVMVFNSDWDAMGRTPLEAMAYGLPVVASMLHGGLGEILDSEEKGTLLKSHDVPAMAKRVIDLLTNESLAQRVGEAARRHISEIGSPQRHAEKVAALLSVSTINR
jgi:glycosyltransferase involved in cell wall biosynthesis